MTAGLCTSKATCDDVLDIQVGAPDATTVSPMVCHSSFRSFPFVPFVVSGIRVRSGVLLVHVLKHEYQWHPSGQGRAPLCVAGDPLVW